MKRWVNFADIGALKEAVIDAAEQSDELRGKRVLITCGATQEAIDPVRYITNHSSGKIKTFLAMQAKRMEGRCYLNRCPR